VSNLAQQIDGAEWASRLRWFRRWELRNGESIVATFRHVNALKQILLQGTILGDPWFLRVRRLTPTILESQYTFRRAREQQGEPLAEFVLRGLELRSSLGSEYELRTGPKLIEWRLMTKGGSELLGLRQGLTETRVHMSVGDAGWDCTELPWLMLCMFHYYESTFLGV